MLRFSLLLIFLYFRTLCCGQANDITDGPYLFYSGDTLFNESIIKGEVKKEVIDLHNKTKISIAVPTPEKGGSFEVVLKKELAAAPAIYKAPDKLFVLSDIEGDFNGIYRLLLAGGVIDEKYNWAFAKGHLVICGDLFDRGTDVAACLWLFYKLEAEAIAKGGYVHIILGNHDIMNMSEDFRYVHPKYMEASSLLNRSYSNFYTGDAELGRWLRTKNIMEKIGDWLFLHAGVSQAVNEKDLSLKTINKRVQPYYDKDGFDSLLLQGDVITFFNGNTSPFWYRGYFELPKASDAQVDSTLEEFHVKKIIVGHTIVDSIQSLYNGKVVAIDVNYHKGNYQALYIEGNQFYSMNVEGEKRKLD